MYIAVNDYGDAWDGHGWGWKKTIHFVSPGMAVRKLQEAGEDIEYVTIIEDPFVLEDHAIPC